MKTPAIPDNEAERINALRELLILDTNPEDRFDIITTYAAAQFSVPIALVSLIDTDRQWFKSAYGLEAKETSRDISFCGHAILQGEVFEISDATLDPRFMDNPLVTGEPKIRFYAGYPLTLKNGHRVGTLCLIDRKPNRLDEWEREHLKILAKMVSAELQGIPASSIEGFPAALSQPEPAD